MAARLWALVLCLVVSLPHAGLAQATLGQAEARVLAGQLYAQGQAAAAREIAITLLRETPDDFDLLLLLARADRALGRFGTATWASNEAWKAARTDPQRFEAAMVRAQVLSSDGKRNAAQFWLRRAAQVAPDDAARAAAVRDFRYVRARNPLTTRLSFGARPSSNINNGSKSDTMVIDGLPFRLSGAAQALSGIELSYGVSTEYRRTLGPRQSLRFGLAVDGRSYILSSEAKAQAPDARASEFAYASAELSFGTTLSDASGDGATHLDLVLGQNWYGGDGLSRFARLTAARDMRLSDRDLLRFSLQLEDQARQDQSVRSSQAGTLRGNWTRKMASGGQLSFGLGWRETASDATSVAHSAALANIGWSFGTPVFGAQTSVSLNLEARDYGLGTFRVAREDQRATVGVSFLFSEIDYYGFAPVLSLTAERNLSNIAIYDTEGLGLSIGIQSVF